MIKYRPHRGSLTDAMKEEMKFNSVDEMFRYIVEKWNKNIYIFEVEDLILSEDKGKDERIDWKETRHICTKRMGENIYNTPQCIGMCSIEAEED